ncbi:phospholipase effector Tle1 domain-containing protein [Capnocytophaga sp. oral taxon 336]|jgi:hypothetical protein|uniref:phospholipase effector Tle1 domain-containing protein n=1 Tax=Capnocytophaga sp. oral taxon 336 TaxID=712216 RepID=UPI00034E49BC|nr:DUF2235 domain-containing protein [Capnocytophaga sp. oral taxon 336]EPD99689.1 hypothetical protein HMPREF1528_01611 [Capnocytophaga sp. oral taxon 336 str. F0502]
MAQTFVYNSGTYQETNSGTSDLEFGLFFDGTLNNKNNTDLRLKVLNQNDLKIRPTDDVEIILWKEEMIEERRKRFEKDSLDKYSDNKDELDPKDITDYQIADKRSGTDKLGVDNSLMNDYTNVARMWKCCDDNYRIYIEGIGTLDKQKDIDDGFRFGAGETGIRGKVRRGCEELAKKIEPKILKRNDEIIEITLDVFGFSRGAAAARNFLYEVNVSNKREEDTKITKSKKYVGTHLEETSYYTYSTNDIIAEKQFVREYEDILLDKDNVEVDPQYLIDGKMPKYGYLGYYLLEKVKPEVLDRIRLNIRFVGLYDTVSSYEESGNLMKGMLQASHLADYFDDDVEQLQLNNLGKFQQAVHFTAMDEHRENFALTKLQPQENNCNYIEKTFPGVHCDIGGAYETGTEIVDEIEVCPVIISLFSSELEDLKSKLISDCWYMESQLEIKIELQRDEERVAKHLELFKKRYDRFLEIIGGVTGANLIRYKKLRGVRFLWKEYSYIPLHFMESYFLSNLSDNCEKIFSMTTIDEYSIKSHPKLVQAKEWLEKYVFGNGEKWSFIPNIEEIIKGKIIKLKGKKPLHEATKDRLEERRYKVMLDNKHQYTELIKVLNQEKELRDRVINENPIIANHFILETLRTYYLHWSANRDWFGMDPTSDRIRKEY